MTIQEDTTAYNVPVKHAMTVDVEDYFHVSAFARALSPSDWDNWPSRVEANTEKLLLLFESADIKATFFVLGWVAERYPSLISKISNAGHEIASHGYSHQLVYKQSPAVFKEETRKSKEILEDIVQKNVVGYRAASYSITRQSLWALDILGELGFTWDSSIFPVHHDRYGMPGTPEEPYNIFTRRQHTLREFPLTTAKIMGLSIPAAGGGYFRQYPYLLSRYLFKKASCNDSKPGVFYLHPWEIDPNQPRVPDAGRLSNFRHYTNLKRCLPRLERMLQDFSFGTITESLASYEIHQFLDLEQYDV